MVMKRNIMGKNLRQTIRRSLGRYIAIVAIIALGAGIFIGLRVTKADMVATGQKYTDDQNMFDLRLLSSYGWNQSDVDEIAELDGVVDAEGSITLDVYAHGKNDNEDEIYRLYSLPQTINRVYLLGGRMPKNDNECLVDGDHVTDAVLGTKIIISDANDEETLESLNQHTYTVVGYISTPLYMDMSRGSTSLGNGSLSSYIYIPETAFTLDYYTEINVTIPGSWAIYTESYKNAMDDAAETVKPMLMTFAEKRYQSLRQEAEKAYLEGKKEYESGLREYETEKKNALQELEDALKKLEEGQAEIDKNRQELLDGEAQIRDAQAEIDKNADTITQSRLELENKKAETYQQLAEANKELLENYKSVINGLKELEDGLEQLEDGLAQIAEGIPQIEDGLAQIENGLPQLDMMISLQNTNIASTKAMLDAAKNGIFQNEAWIKQLEERLATQQVQLAEYTAQKQEALDTQAELEKQLADLTTQQQELQAQKTELEGTRVTLNNALDTIEEGFVELENSQAQADNQFAAAQAQLDAAQLQLDAGQRELDAKKAELEEGKQDLEAAQTEINQGRTDYETGKAEADREFADAEAKLKEAEAELKDARQSIDDLKQPEVYVLTRNSNVGYMALDSNSDIVSGVSRVFPFFFLLIAALVCITTMTRMVDEERTQIGTLKALGYGNQAIINKYLYYAGSAAILGCGVGAIVGSVALPMILWGAYGIIFNITPNVVLTFDWLLIAIVVVAYTTVSLSVTWLCCRRSLREVPAELIRPKAPTSGQKLFLEKLPFWNRFSFLNKVMLRNVFRYRQRLMMMLVGIGGCTALLLTGFGIRDSIVNIVDYQFRDITKYDVSVYFDEGQTQEQQEAFRMAMDADVEDVGFIHQSSVELMFGDRTWDLYLMAAEKELETFVDFHKDSETVEMPEKDQALVTVGVAEALGINIGDTVTVRNTDMQTMELRVAGIYENHVNNYVVITPETMEANWGEKPEFQVALLNTSETTDVYALSAKLSKMDGVMSVTVSEEQADMVNSMMDALTSVVITIVVCAGLLAGTVLYNLTNINITERIREIATIKVLGFNAKETSAYVFKENILLSVMGTVLGLFGGKLLLEFVMSQIKIDMVWFLPRLTVPSYLLAVILTMLAAVVVDFVFHYKLDKINMAEALKSVE